MVNEALGVPEWLWVLIVPAACVFLSFGWVLLALHRSTLTSLQLKGFGISMQLRASSVLDERAACQKKDEKEDAHV